MREITGHTTFEDNPLRIAALDEPSASGCNNHYHIDGYDTETHQSDTAAGIRQFGLDILFQSGPPPVVGFNGITIEAILCICADRLQGFQKGPFPNDLNDGAIFHIEEAIKYLHNRSLAQSKKK